MVNTVIVNVAGPQGPAGVVEDDLTFAKRVDFITGTEDLYRGEAPVGTQDSNSSWRIRKILINSEGDVTELWAAGTDLFDKVWDNRANLTYT